MCLYYVVDMKKSSLGRQHGQGKVKGTRGQGELLGGESVLVVQWHKVGLLTGTSREELCPAAFGERHPVLKLKGVSGWNGGRHPHLHLRPPPSRRFQPPAARRFATPPAGCTCTRGGGSFGRRRTE